MKRPLLSLRFVHVIMSIKVVKPPERLSSGLKLLVTISSQTGRSISQPLFLGTTMATSIKAMAPLCIAETGTVYTHSTY